MRPHEIKVTDSSGIGCILYYRGWLISYKHPPLLEVEWKNLKFEKKEDGREMPQNPPRTLSPLRPLSDSERHALKQRAIAIIKSAREREEEGAQQEVEARLQPRLELVGGGMK